MSVARGTTPEGAADEEQAARWVRGMFGRVASRYDLLNHVLSFQVDRAWRAATARRAEEILRRPEARVLDLCCGTGDLMLELEKRRRACSGRSRDLPERSRDRAERSRDRKGAVVSNLSGDRAPTSPLIFGSDFCHPMLVEAIRKAANKQARAVVFEADALQLPLADASFDLITCAFGFRNFANYRKGLSELRRVLRPGGMLAILEFSQPPNRFFASFYAFYSKCVLPRIGALISGSPDAYTYLPESVRKFPGAESLAEEMRAMGYLDVEFERMTFGVVALHIGRT
jgi:demethylmenaquinone methyltransferase/2-methoxy-6-polyprenyl-1,4-benzoquinol methylase